MLSRLVELAAAYRLATALLILGLAGAVAVGLWAESFAAAGYVGAILGVVVGMVIAYTNARHEGDRRSRERDR